MDQDFVELVDDAKVEPTMIINVNQIIKIVRQGTGLQVTLTDGGQALVLDGTQADQLVKHLLRS